MINSTLNCEAYSSFEGMSSDHWTITAKIHLSQRRNRVQTTTTAHCDWSLLNNKEIGDKYTIMQKNQFDTLQEISETSTPNDEYENFVNAYIEAIAERILTKLRTRQRVPCKTLAVKKKRDNVKAASLCKRRNPNNANAQKLKKAQSELKNAYLN